LIVEELTPRAKAKRRQITQAARSLFLGQGFARTSMDAVTAEAGVSKQTLYSYFSGKDDLLLAVLVEELSGLFAPRKPLPPPTTLAGLRATLCTLANTLLDTMMREEMIAIFRLMIGEVVHLPEIRARFLEAMPMQIMGRARAVLQAAHEAGVIELEHVDLSVRMFIGPLFSFIAFNGLLSTEAPVRPGPEVVDTLVEVYLRTLTPGGAR
jgi:TetR/AcrR family transcriptional repressor of mexJK operon